MANRKATTTLASTLIAGLAVATLTPPANASTTYTWIQQVQRASADAPCDIPAIEGDAAGWSDWRPSWAQWPNDDQGGWVCTRSITWAQGTAAPGSGSGGSGGSGVASCVAGFSGDLYLSFAGTDWIPAGTAFYSDAACTTPEVPSATLSDSAALADDGTEAQTICTANDPGTSDVLVGGSANPRLYYCS